jgi:hypothetical protein
MMNRRHLLLAACSALPLHALAADEVPPAARQAVEHWLALVDAGDHGASWHQAGAVFRTALTQKQWMQAVGGARRPLGELRRRAPKSAQPTHSLPGLPEGQYVVFQFDAVFAQQASVVETVTAQQEADGAWRVIGYYLR